MPLSMNEPLAKTPPPPEVLEELHRLTSAAADHWAQQKLL
jgi:hypothetical protein